MTGKTRNICPLSATLAVIASLQCANAAITFTPGHYYSANYFSRSIIEYDSAGSAIGSFDVAPALASEVRGITFGPDNLLYATAVRGSGFAVLGFDSSGALRETYPMSSVNVFGNISYGKIAVDSQHIYVAGATQVTRFDVGNPASGTSIYGNNQFGNIFDIKILPSGNLLAASGYDINEIAASGALVRSIGLTGNSFSGVRGIEYDPLSNNLFVTQQGQTGAFYQLMRIDGTSGLLERSVTFNNGDDLFLTGSGDLIVGSRTQPPRIYTQDLDAVGTLGTAPQMFVTQYTPVPEPSACALLVTAGLGFCIVRTRRHGNAA